MTAEETYNEIWRLLDAADQASIEAMEAKGSLAKMRARGMSVSYMQRAEALDPRHDSRAWREFDK